MKRKHFLKSVIGASAFLGIPFNSFSSEEDSVQELINNTKKDIDGSMFGFSCSPIKKVRVGIIGMGNRGNTLLEINDELVEEGTLEIGDAFFVGPYKIIFETPPNDVDLKLSIELSKNLKSKVSDLVSRSNIDASNFGMSKRILSWSLFSLTAIIFLLIPL